MAHSRTSKVRPRHRRIELEDACSIADDHPEDLLDLDEALCKLAEEDPVKADLVKLRYFAGLSSEEAADALGVSRATADRYRLALSVHSPAGMGFASRTL